ncbi:anaphase promoting complex subunit 10 [Drepanopeziza brunnea f. sp. 'multigermtubi' MB_m1]|uniref:Anaphase promoting complex subunit 10 n=1 Tax=Marssonina brunnea f. sp. multigermtubi (strain MB_m1) TaxID=1072389 RepID=K1X2T1_MARBU|nr:anaphase promoting complex subunit 10 [Drepanopeziza brunnea f. sp. 'multigermtubi' MB_m1]EKD19531.1 anaphase promoting complex subunit 10 [Drepanopeziza brunnea f. sp. 'multigermtubi' MB_m1]
MPPAQTPSPASNFLPTFRFRRPPWESRDAPQATPVTAAPAAPGHRALASMLEGGEDGLSTSSSSSEPEPELTNAEEEGGGRDPRTAPRARGGGGEGHDWEEGEDDEDHEDDEEEGEEEGVVDDEEEEGAYDEGIRSVSKPESAMPTPQRATLPPSPPAEEDIQLITGQMRLIDIMRRTRLETGRAERPSPQRADEVGRASRNLANLTLNEVPMEIDNPFDPTALGLREIGNLASWTVSSCKPGCGVDALRDDDTGLFWQSDGPQPHHLNIHFSRLVSILSIRIFLDFEADESYTPTRITLLAGTAYHDLIPFAALSFEQPKGWIDVPLDHVGGAPDGRTLRVFLVQVRIIENHQNGKDTHLRGLKIYARDDRASRGLNGLIGEKQPQQTTPVMERQAPAMERSWLAKPDWMGEPELR